MRMRLPSFEGVSPRSEARIPFSTAFKINIACERLPQYSAFDPAKCGFPYPTYSHIGPTIEYLERAYDDAKWGDWSRDPFITPVAPSFVDDTIAQLVPLLQADARIAVVRADLLETSFTTV